jgi:hypothetical protein
LLSFASLHSGERYMVACIFFVWSILGYAKDSGKGGFNVILVLKPIMLSHYAYCGRFGESVIVKLWMV